MQRVVALARVAEEADIIEPFVRHHAAMLDHIVVQVEPFAARTQAILQRLAQEGLPLTVRPPLSPGFRQGEDTTVLARSLLTDGHADVVIPLDADEFIHVPREGYLRAALAQLAHRFGCWRWRNLAPTSLGEDGDVLARMSLARRDEPLQTPVFKVILPRQFATGSHWLAEGHHCVFDGPAGDYARSTPCPMVELKAVRLLHMPIRSLTQVSEKARLARAVLAARQAVLDGPADPSGAANHWLALGQLLDRGALTLPTLQQAALNYPDVLAPTRPATEPADG
jgi:hypothetical protein